MTSMDNNSESSGPIQAGGLTPQLRDAKPAMSRRKFVVVTSGCLFCGTGGASRAFAGIGKPVDVGLLKEYAKDGISEKFVDRNFFVIRYQGRLFATIATCPHKGNFLVRDSRNANRIVCTGHDAVFTPGGVPTGGPVKRGLPRFAIALNDQGHVLVNPNQEFPQNEWNDKRSYLAVQ
ncbi:MAG: Rieske 2Fe-2S domain-containing protein [Verrucomicrobiota bacterium]